MNWRAKVMASIDAILDDCPYDVTVKKQLKADIFRVVVDSTADYVELHRTEILNGNARPPAHT